MAEPQQQQQQQPTNLDALIDAAAAGRPQAQAPASNELDMLIENAGSARQRTLTPQQVVAEMPRQTVLARNALKAGTVGLLDQPKLGLHAPDWAQPEKVPGPPLTAGERYGYGALAAVPATAAIAGAELATGGGATPAIIGAGANILGALGGQAANEFAPAVPYAPELVGTALGFLGSPLANVARKTAAAKAAGTASARTIEQMTQAQAAAKAAKDHQEAIRRLYTDPISGLLSKEEAQLRLKLRPIGNITHATDTGVRQAETQISDVAANLHPTIATAQEFGQSAQEIARNWWNVVKPQKIAQYAQDLYSRLPAGTAVADVPAPINNLAASLHGINTTAGTLEPLAQALKPRLGAQLYRTFENEFESPAATRAVEGLPEQGVPARPSEPVTLSDLLQLRTALGDAMADSRITSDIGKDNVKRLYAAASADARAALQEAGVNPRYWNEYNEKTSRLYNLAEGPVSDIISTGKAAEETIRPELIADKIRADKGGSWLQAMRSEPELAAVADHFAAHTLRGKVAGGSAAHKFGGEGSADAWRGLSPEAQAAMIPDAGQRAQLNAAIASREELPKTGKELMDQVETQKMARVQAMKDAHEIAAEKARQQVYDTQVPGKVPSPQGPVGNMMDRISSALSEKFGVTGLAATAGGAYTLAHQLGIRPEMLPAITAASATLPWVAKQGAAAVKSLAQSPGNVRFPAYGLVGGETADNRLMPK